MFSAEKGCSGTFSGELVEPGEANPIIIQQSAGEDGAGFQAPMSLLTDTSLEVLVRELLRDCTFHAQKPLNGPLCPGGSFDKPQVITSGTRARWVCIASPITKLLEVHLLQLRATISFSFDPLEPVPVPSLVRHINVADVMDPKTGHIAKGIVISRKGVQMVKPRRSYTADFKVRVVLELLRGKKNISQASREYGIKDSVLSRWRQEFLERRAADL